MRDQFIAGVKSILRPIVRHRTLIERAKYGRTQILDPQAGNDFVRDLLQTGRPAGIGKMGASELGGLRRYEACKDELGKCTNWGIHAVRLNVNAGVYPAEAEIFGRFSRAFGEAMGDLDVLAVWFQRGENRLREKFAPKAQAVALTALEPYFHEKPWSWQLKGKRVLVISPFTSTIASQYAKKEAVWRSRPGLLPDFTLDTLRCPLSAGLVKPAFADWFAALDAMTKEMDSRQYDVVIVGAGAWSLSLVSHAKRQGRVGIHLGGATQILFGVLGGRWDNQAAFKQMFNESWVRPGEEDRPEAFRKIENGCYW